MKYLILTTLILLPFLSKGENFFREGTEWEVQYIGSHLPNGVYSSSTYLLEESAHEGVMKMISITNNDETEADFIAYIRTDGDKVYFKKDIDSSEWYLMYDFSLSPEEGCYVHNCKYIYETSGPYCSYVKCVGIEKSDLYKDCDILLLEEYDNEACDRKIGEDRWIKGIGSVRGVIENNRSDIDGVGSSLIRVSLNKIDIYGHKISGAENICQDEVLVKSSNHNISVSNLPLGVMLYLYSQEGILLAKELSTTQRYSFDITNKGIYLLLIGECVRKIYVQ